MTPSTELRPLLQGINKADYDIADLDDEIRVDQLCVELLRHLYQDLTQKNSMQPEQAGECCHGADYFLREFVVAVRQENLFSIEAKSIRQFAGHWYITRTPEPNLTELKNILSGTAEFYLFIARHELIPEAAAAEIAVQCRELDYYQQRIDDFWAIEGDGYDAWRQACPL
jgi:hypothetical protein